MDIQLDEVYRNERAGFELRAMANMSRSVRDRGWPLSVEWRVGSDTPWHRLGRVHTVEEAARLIERYLSHKVLPGGGRPAQGDTRR